jgi:segregation and condensation protein B
VIEHITEEIDTEVETTINLTTDQPTEHVGQVEHIDGEAETVIDLTTEQAAEPIDLTTDETVEPVDLTDAEVEPPDESSVDDAVAQAAELIEQIDAEVEAAAQPTDQAALEEPAAQSEPAAAENAADEPPAVDIPLRRVLEAVLLIAEEPLPVVEIATRLEVPAPEVEAAIRELSAEYEEQERGFALREIAGGWRYYTAGECAPEVERFLLAGQTSRLSQAALETLAVVAYQQPVSRSRIAAVRGVSVDGVMKTLVSRGLVAESGTDTESGAIMYVTTPKFLERLGLRDLSELPPLAPLLPGLDELPEE